MKPQALGAQAFEIFSDTCSNMLELFAINSNPTLREEISSSYQEMYARMLDKLTTNYTEDA